MIEVIVNDKAAPTLEAMMREHPRAVVAGLHDLGQYWRKILRKEIRAGNPGGTSLAAHHQMTKDLRVEVKSSLSRRKKALTTGIGHRQGNTVQKINTRFRQLRGFGGRLPDLVEYAVQSQATDGGGSKIGVRIGWMDEYFKGAKPAAEIFQSSLGAIPFTRQQYKLLKSVLGRDYKIPKTYVRPKRESILPYRGDLSKRSAVVFAKAFAARMKFGKK
jgi:hypothetical protein